MNYIKYGWNKLRNELIYSLITIIYLFFLNNLNHVLLLKFNNDDYLEIISYNNFEPFIYFIIAIVLSIIGGVLIRSRIKELQYKDISIEDIILTVISVILIIILVMLIIFFIDNPILRVVISICTSGIVLACAFR